MMAAADCWSPFVPDLDPAEQSARLRALPPGGPLPRRPAPLTSAGSSPRPRPTRPRCGARRVLDALPPNDKRQIRAAYAALARAA